MNELDTRFLTFLLWGGGTIIVYTIVLYQRLRRWRVHRRDRRKSERVEATRGLLSGFTLWLTAFCSGAAVALVLFGQAGTGIRSFAVAIALGAFSGAGIVMATEDADDDVVEVRE